MFLVLATLQNSCNKAPPHPCLEKGENKEEWFVQQCQANCLSWLRGSGCFSHRLLYAVTLSQTVLDMIFFLWQGRLVVYVCMYVCVGGVGTDGCSQGTALLTPESRLIAGYRTSSELVANVSYRLPTFHQDLYYES